MDIATCPWTTYIASLGEDGRLYLYDYYELTLVFDHQFPAKGRALIWLPLNVLKYGNELILAFDDGNLRIVILNLFDSPVEMSLIQVKEIQTKDLLNKIKLLTTL